MDALTGQNAFSNPDLQATWDPLILEQGQKVDFIALLKTMEMAAPRPRYAKITQGAQELFLPFVERLASALEKQVEDDNLRQVLCKILARDNTNDDCSKIINVLPGYPSLTDMSEACSKIGTVDHKMSVLVAALQTGLTSSGDGQRKKGKRKGKQKQGTNSNFLCSRCGKPCHFANKCKSTYHANGKHLAGLGNGGKSAQGNCGLTQVIPQDMAPA